ncbi:YceD family protein [Parablastomonas sp. CN1-191]|uniref:YceD family protein n=1 Tax=Parablastomonas sp. CN1-191 TaxID=3400908 RepID=UPI003BF7EC89
MSEMERWYDRKRLPEGAQAIVADPGEREALARRFAIVSIARFEVLVTLADDGTAVTATGTLVADVVQPCAVSGEDLAVHIAEPVSLRFVAPYAGPGSEDEELDVAMLDEIEIEDDRFDLGEAIAQELALAIDPFATGEHAEETRRAAGLIDETASGPFAALAALKKPN